MWHRSGDGLPKPLSRYHPLYADKGVISAARVDYYVPWHLETNAIHNICSTTAYGSAETVFLPVLETTETRTVIHYLMPLYAQHVTSLRHVV
ncbi:hypothetical protein V2G26_015742 [Clonostachys chloroleuca]